MISSNQVSYPASYKGKFPLPELSGKSLKHVPLSIGPFDHWGEDGTNTNPNNNKGCNTSFRAAFLNTIERARALGSNRISITQYVCNYAGLEKLHEAPMNISDTDLIWMASQVKSLGLDATYAFQICDQGEKAHDISHLERVMDSYEKTIMKQARIVESAGYTAMSVDWGHWQPDWNLYAEIRSRRLSQVADSLRTVFSGKLYLIHNWGEETTSKDLMKKVDYIWWMPTAHFTAEEEKNLTVELALNKFRQSRGHFNSYGSEPVEVVVRTFSHDAPTTKGWTEMTGCFAVNQTCGHDYITDFSVQAILTEAALRYISELPQERLVGVTFKNYWLTDTVQAHDSFPNLGWNIRNKPAEHIVYKWWKE
jgi:hypothetical protein